MNSDYFFAQDQAGNLQRIRVLVSSTTHEDSRPVAARSGYALDDGSTVERIDNDTFRIIGTGALVTVVRE